MQATLGANVKGKTPKINDLIKELDYYNLKKCECEIRDILDNSE